ncbi:MAG: hypothetical protein NZM09_00290 [Ignavibacterium sp.]|nr:hypothetical protein [Ignavibacterium sp.]MDW8374108.1 hypothetical protein [Ignavibacteriales bacterium]
MPISSISENGKKFLGYTNLKILVGEGSTTILLSELHLFASGYNKTDGKIKGEATIIVSTKPTLFSTEASVEMNLWGALCGNANLLAYIDDKQWFVKVGSKENSNIVKVLCSNVYTYKNYLEINTTIASMGIFYDFDT